MKPNKKFLRQPKHFWAHVRTISQNSGYTIRGKNQIKVPTILEIKTSLEKVGLCHSQIITDKNKFTKFGHNLVDYFKYRAAKLNTYVEPRLMDLDRAKKVYEALYNQLSPTCPIPMNKQKGKKKTPSYLTAIVNMLIEANINDYPCNYDPRTLATVSKHGQPLRTFARRIDGAFTNTLNPIAVWELKEYYHTTTFGSRVADGVYETLLDGMEFQELYENEGIKILHYLIVDAHYTWWTCGKSYLCRIIDMLHMGYVDEVLFGYEVVEKLPLIARDWVKIARKREKPSR